MPRLGLIEELFVNPHRAPSVVATHAQRRLVALVRRAAAQSPFYRELYASAGVDAGAFAGRSDLPHLPMVDKEMLVDAGERVLTGGERSADLVRMRTSGTSGRAIEVTRSRYEMRVTRRGVLRHLMYQGFRPWYRVLTLGSGWLRDRKGVIIGKVVKTRFLEPLMPVDEQVKVLHDFAPQCLVGQTGGLYLLARELRRRGLTYPLRAVAPTGATLTREMRATLRAAFVTEPRDMYGAIEVGPIAWQCKRGAYHVDADRIIVEIVDEHGRPAPAGAWGQVVVTGLFTGSMPLIRYRLRDVSALSTAACGCRLNFPVMEQTRGRINDFLPTPRGDLVSPHFFFHIFDGLPQNPVREWTVIQEDVGRLVFEYVPEQDCTAEAIRHGVDRISERFGDEARVEARQVARIPLTPAGKQRCIVSKLRPDDASWFQAWAQRPAVDEAEEVLQ